MEKYSRQALAEGVKNVNDLVVTNDCELYRVLILHYNRNNQIEVRNFAYTTPRKHVLCICNVSVVRDKWIGTVRIPERLLVVRVPPDDLIRHAARTLRISCCRSPVLATKSATS